MYGSMPSKGKQRAVAKSASASQRIIRTPIEISPLKRPKIETKSAPPRKRQKLADVHVISSSDEEMQTMRASHPHQQDRKGKRKADFVAPYSRASISISDEDDIEEVQSPAQVTMLSLSFNTVAN